MKRRNRKQRPVCPACNIGRHTKEMTTSIELFKLYHQQQFPNLDNTINDQHFLNVDFEWACDDCLSSGKAVTAIPDKQVTSGFPNLAYSDSEYQCSTCEQPFLFKKEEKQLWYEQLQFSIHSIPDNCTDCRAVIRKKKVENKQLSALLKRPETELTIKELEQIISIYTAWEKPDRVAYFKAVLKKN